jgi:hypothetical protein
MDFVQPLLAEAPELLRGYSPSALPSACRLGPSPQPQRALQPGSEKGV